MRIERGRDAQGLAGGGERVEESGGRRSRHAEARPEAGRGEARGTGFEEEEVREVPFVAAGEHGEDGEEVSCVARLRAAPALETRAPGVEHAPASHRLDGRRPPEDEAISGARGHRRLQRDLKETFRARHERAFAGSVRPGTRPEKVNAPGDIGGPEMNAQARAVGEGASDGRQPGDLRREHGGGLEPSSVLTAEVTWLPSVRSPLADGARLRVHLGTADIAGRVHLLGASPGADTPGERAFVPGSKGFFQITLESPVPARPGDRFVLRRPSPVETVGGGRVLDAGRPRLKRRGGAEASHAAHLLSVLSVLSGGDERDLADLFLLEAGPSGLTAARLGPRLGVSAPAAAALLDALSSSGKALRIAPALYAHAGTASSLAERAAAAFAERRKSGGVSVSFAKSEFAERLGRALSPAAADGWIAVLLASKKIALDGDRIVPPGAKAADLAGDSASFAAKIAEGFRAAGFEPPHPHELARVLGTKPAVVEGLVSHLVKSGTLVRLSPDLVVHRDVALAAEQKLDSARGQTLSVAGFRDLLGLTRKTLIPLLEYFDAKKKTRRMGDVRKVE